MVNFYLKRFPFTIRNLFYLVSFCVLFSAGFVRLALTLSDSKTADTPSASSQRQSDEACSKQ